MLTYCTRKLNNRATDCLGVTSNNSVKIRSTKEYNRELFIEKLNENDWSKLFLCRNVDKAWDIFKEIFITTLNKVAPLKEVKIKKHTEPWVNSEILETISERDHYLLSYKKNGNKYSYLRYCKLRNKVQRLVKDAKSNFLKTK